ncbi:MAG TPA: VOC family protein [Woeseiaceae bacterium]|nr:VOC family protein [Woeseiaceae bacterium]
MHRSRLGGFIIDCRTDDLDTAAAFWGAALGAPPRPRRGADGELYVELARGKDELYAEVQRVEHDSRVHLDIETDDIVAEVARLEALGARRIANIEDWCVMEAPTGQRFCVVPVVSADFAAKAHRWE